MGLEPLEFFYANLLHEQILFVIWNSKNQQQPIVQEHMLWFRLNENL